MYIIYTYTHTYIYIYMQPHHHRTNHTPMYLLAVSDRTKQRNFEDHHLEYVFFYCIKNVQYVHGSIMYIEMQE